MIEHDFDWGPTIRGLISLSVVLVVMFLWNRRSAYRRPAPGEATTASLATRVRWRDHTVEVNARAVPRYGWLTTSINVYLDDVALIRTGGVLRIRGTTEAAFEERGEKHIMKLAWRSPPRGLDFPVQLSMDNQVVIDSKVRPPTWPLSLIMIVLSATILVSSVAIFAHLLCSYIS